MAYLGHKPAVGENNSFRILDDISSFVLTFDGSSASVVGLSDETITITENNHRFITGQRVTYSNGGGGNITGLTNGQAYFIINHSKTQIKLASSASNALAGTAVNLTGLGTGSSHTLTLAFDGINTKFDPTFGNGMHDTLIKRAAQLVISINGVIQQPHDTATPTTGFGVDSLGHIIFSTAPASTDIFWGHILATNTVTFDSSDNDVDTFTGNGSTTSFTLSKIPPDNRNILVTIDGVVQYPSDAANTRSYNVSENVMTFVAAPGLGTVIQVRHIGYAGIGAGGGGGVTGFYGRTGNVSLQSTDNIVANNATFNGNVSIAQTLTYEDVTDIDAVGLITARSGIKDLTLTSGHVVFAGTGGRLSGEADLFYDASNNRLGIGTNAPTRELTLYSPDSGSTYLNLTNATTGGGQDQGFLLGLGGDEAARILQQGNANMELATNATTRILIKSTGEVGINTTDATHQLTVFAKTANSTIARFKALNRNSNFDIITDASSHGSARVRNNIGATKVLLNSNGDSYFTGGDVGIGTDNPLTELHIHGETFTDITIHSERTSGNIGGINFRKGGVTSGIMTAQYLVDVSGNHYFYSQGSQRLKSASDGDLTITGSDNAELKLKTGTSTGNDIIAFQNSDGATKGNIFYDTDNNFMVFKTNGTASSNERLRITSSGDVGIKSTAPRGKLDIQFDGAPNYITFDSDADNPKMEWFRSTGGSPSHYATEIQMVLGDLVLSTSTANLGSHSYEEKLRIKSDGKVGIGTDNPKLNLHIHQNNSNASFAHFTNTTTGYDSNQGLSIGLDSDEHAVMYHYGTNNIRFATDNTQHMVLRSTGQLGIGTAFTPPADAKKLTVICDSVGDGIHIGNKENLYPAGSTGYSDIRFSFYDYLTGGYQAGGEAIIRGYSRNAYTNSRTTDLIFMTCSDDGDPSSGTATEKLRIRSDGKVILRSDGASTSDGFAGLEIRQPNGGKHLVLTNTSATADGNEIQLGFKLHGSGQKERIKAGVIAKAASTHDYGQVKQLSFCINNAASNSNVSIASDEKFRIQEDGQVKWNGITLSQRNAATGVDGGLIYNSEGKIFQYYDGSGWISLNTTNQIVATGGNTVSTSGGYRIHDFQGNGTFEITSGVGEVEVLVVAGGGSEGGASSGCHAGGGGGGGGVVYKKMNMSAGKYTVTIGAGGLWRNNGENTTFGSGTDHQIIALGGGAGGPTLTGNGNAGGSGGGGSRHTTTNQGGAATQPSSADGGFGNAGGDTGDNTYTGGGGGAGGAGQDGDAANAGRGGPGKQFTQFGVSIYFGAGGNAQGSHTSEGQTPTSANGAGNTGAGAGGSAGGGTRYYGGSGRVMIRYPAAS